MSQPLDVKVRPLLVSAMLATDGSGRPVILVDDAQPPEQQRIAFWHEVVHLILGGEPHDEAEVEAMAQRLCAAWPEALERALQGRKA